VRVVLEHVEDVRLVEREKPLTFHFFGVVNPPNDIIFIVLDEFVLFHVCLFIPIVAFRWKMRIVIDVLVLVCATILPFVGVFPDVQDAMNA
jgi:hypothetical protein